MTSSHPASLPRRGTTAYRGRDRWPLVAVAGAMSFVAMLDMSVVNIALPSIGADLRLSPGYVLWVSLGYQLAVVSLILPVGAWLDSANHAGGRRARHRTAIRPALLTAILGYAALSITTSVAASPPLLIAARTVQGACGAVLFVLMPVVAASAVGPESRARAMSIPASLGPLGAVTGPALGGILLDQFGWRSVFWIKVPICLIAWLIASRELPRGYLLPGLAPGALRNGVWVAGGVATILLLLTASETRPSWLLLLPMASLPLAIWFRSQGAAGIKNVLTTFKKAGTAVAVLAIALAHSGMTYLVAQHLQLHDHMSASHAGLVIVSGSLAMAAVGQIGGRIADRIGSRPVSIAGAFGVIAGLTALFLQGEHWQPTATTIAIAIIGMGMGLYGGPTQAMMMASVPPTLRGTAGSAVQFSRSLGFTMGPPLAGAAWSIAGRTADARLALAVSVVSAATAALLLWRTGREPPTAAHGESASPAHEQLQPTASEPALRFETRKDLA